MKKKRGHTVASTLDFFNSKHKIVDSHSKCLHYASNESGHYPRRYECDHGECQSKNFVHLFSVNFISHSARALKEIQLSSYEKKCVVILLCVVS
jgi:hypothetical protein